MSDDYITDRPAVLLWTFPNCSICKKDCKDCDCSPMSMSPETEYYWDMVDEEYRIDPEDEPLLEKDCR